MRDMLHLFPVIFFTLTYSPGPIFMIIKLRGSKRIRYLMILYKLRVTSMSMAD